MDISVIIATRNRSAWLPTCLAHLEQQTFPAARFEVILADAGSTDDTVSVARRFASGSPVRIQVLALEAVRLAVARNRAAAASRGRVLFFLADDELASPRLLQTHAEAQGRRDERGCLTGAVHRHPQLPPHSSTRLSLSDAPDREDDPGAPYYLDAQDSNVSLPRRIFEQFRGFTEEPAIERLEHIELAYRLYREGIEWRGIEDARSYVWQPAVFETERERHYQIGYSLYSMLRLTGANSILQHYRLRRSRFEQIAARLLMPHYIRACRRQEQENKLFVETLYRRILSHDRARGFEDARNNRPRQSPVHQEAAATRPRTVPA